MTELQAWIVIALLAGIAASLFPLGKQIERFIRVVIHQRELVEQALSHPDDDGIRLQLKVFLEEANGPAHEQASQRVRDRIEHGLSRTAADEGATHGDVPGA